MVLVQEWQLKSAGELTQVDQPADFAFVCRCSIQHGTYVKPGGRFDDSAANQGHTAT